MKCKNCGYKLRKNDSFCSRCGQTTGRDELPVKNGTWRIIRNYEAEDREQFRNRIIWVIVGVVIVAIGFLSIRSGHNYSYEDIKGNVSIYPKDSQSKNYRLEAQLNVSSRAVGLVGAKKSYDVDRVFWPNGGSTFFEECEPVPDENKSICYETSSIEWLVEIHEDTLEINGH